MIIPREKSVTKQMIVKKRRNIKKAEKNRIKSDPPNSLYSNNFVFLLKNKYPKQIKFITRDKNM